MFGFKVHNFHKTLKLHVKCALDGLESYSSLIQRERERENNMTKFSNDNDIIHKLYTQIWLHALMYAEHDQKLARMRVQVEKLAHHLIPFLGDFEHIEKSRCITR